MTRKIGMPLHDASLERYDEDGNQTVFAISPFGASETREERLARWEASGNYDPACPGCAVIRGHPRLAAFAPHHKALASCGSGGRPHCTCPRCWG